MTLLAALVHRRELVHEFKTKGPLYRRTVQTTLRASYTGHYRRGLVALLGVLEFRSNDATHRPVIDALALIRRYASVGNLTYYPLGEPVPTHRGTTGDWSSLIYRTDTRGRDRVARMVYEAAPEPVSLRRLKAEVGRRWGTVASIDVLKETVPRTGCLDQVSAVAGGGALPAEVLAERLMLAIHAYGINTGIRAVAAGGWHQHSEEQLRYARRRCLTREAAG